MSVLPRGAARVVSVAEHGGVEFYGGKRAQIAIHGLVLFTRRLILRARLRGSDRGVDKRLF